jgi:hypothetical protein
MKVEISFKYEGKMFEIQESRWEGMDLDTIFYLYEEGNYSCDCNRSLFIREKYPEFPELGCGETIEMTQIVVFNDQGEEVRREKYR